MRVYRVSEYAFDVDFLENHDAASVDAMPLYLMTCDPSGDCSPWSTSDLTDRWGSCQAALGTDDICAEERGNGFDCMACMEEHADAVTDACGEWTMEDSLSGEGSFGVHWYCGVGWPESTAAQGPITEYCIEFLPLSNASVDATGQLSTSASSMQSANANSNHHNNADDEQQQQQQQQQQMEMEAAVLPDEYFSGYLSCNSDEVDGVYLNQSQQQTPWDPLCICICYDDRLLARQPLQELRRDCDLSPSADRLPWVDEVNCNCPGTDSPIPAVANTSATGAAASMAGENPSLTFIGRAPVFLPYVGVDLKPHAVAHLPWLVASGHNYHFPRGGACAEGEPLGSGGCTWRRVPAARMIYGQDLLDAGWSRAFVPDTPKDQNHTKANIQAFKAALENLSKLVLPASQCLT